MNSDIRHTFIPKNPGKSAAQSSGINASFQNFSQTIKFPSSGIRAPSGNNLSSGIRPPTAINPSANANPPKVVPSQKATELNVKGLRPPTRIRPPQFQPQTSSSNLPISAPAPRITGTIPKPQKVIPLPGASNKLATIPKPIRIPGDEISNIPIPSTVKVTSSTLLPKPAFMQHVAQPASRHLLRTPAASLEWPLIKPGLTLKFVPPSRQQATIPSVGSQKVEKTGQKPSATLEKTPLRTTDTAKKVLLPRTAIKKRVISSEPSSEVYRIAGRDVEFIDWVAPEESPVPSKTVEKRVIRPGKAHIVKGILPSKPSPSVIPAQRRTPKPKKTYEFAEEPSVTAAKQFAIQLDDDLTKVRQMGQEMQELKRRKSSVLDKIKSMYAKEGRVEPQTAPLNVDEFRERYGITQSPKMRQLLELTKKWNQNIIEEKDVQQKLSKLITISPGTKAKVVPSLDIIVDTVSPEIMKQYAEQQLDQQEKINNYKQAAEIHREYRNMLEERRKDHVIQKPLAKQEREEIRKFHQDAQEDKYTRPAEKELENPQRLADMMKLQEHGLPMTDTPDRTVEILFSEATPKADIIGAAGNVPIPIKIPVEKMSTINSLDRSTAEAALNTSLAMAPADNVAKTILESSLQEITTQAIQPVPQSLDPLYEINLKLDRPKRQNLIQLQGSSQPFWFPGFHAIFPGSPGLLQITKSPSDTLLMAQRKIQPSVAF